MQGNMSPLDRKNPARMRDKFATNYDFRTRNELNQGSGEKKGRKNHESIDSTKSNCTILVHKAPRIVTDAGMAMASGVKSQRAVNKRANFDDSIRPRG